MSEPAVPPDQAAGAQILLELAKKIGESWGDLDRGLRHITETASRALGVERASIWLFDPTRTSLCCSDLYERSRDAHSSGMRACVTDYPDYFRALLEARTLATDDVRSDPHSQELQGTCAAQAGIRAMLDAPLRHQGTVVGVLSNEQVGAPHTWSDTDRSIAGSLADFAVLALEAHERRLAEEALRDREARLHAIMDETYDVIVGMREDGRFYFVSSSASQVLGYPEAQLLAEEGWPHVHPDDRAHAFDLIHSDVQMPGMGGAEISERARQIVTGTPELLRSGNTSAAENPLCP